MAIFFVIFILAVISIALSVRSLLQMKKRIHEVEKAGESLARNKVVFHGDHVSHPDSGSDSSSSSSEVV